MPLFLSLHFDQDVDPEIQSLIHEVLGQGTTPIQPRCATTRTFALTLTDPLGPLLDLHQALISRDQAAALALHVGAASRLGETYRSPSVEHTRCLAESGWPEQILLSQAFMDVHQLPSEAKVADLGLQRLKDLTPSKHIYQLAHPSLRKRDFPTLRTLNRVPHNLRPQGRPFIGRQAEIAALAAPLRAAERRLITLKGPGGIGKTRLALQVAAETAIHFPDGVYFLSLVSVESPDTLGSTLVDTLDLTLRGRRPAHNHILTHLRTKRMLLILDNFEQLLPAPSLLTEMLEAAPDLRLLVTSRVALEIPEEQVYPVAGLAYPTEQDGHPTGTYDAVRLFVQAAQRVDPLFVLSEENRLQVYRICRQLMGMPLGIELAAAWVRVFSASEIAAQLREDMESLTTNRRDILERHRSLQLVFDHSWRLLTEQEQEVFPKLPVFYSGFRAEAAAAIADASPEILTSLHAKSFLSLSSNGRYRILQPLWQLATKELTLQPSLWQRLRDRHAAYYTDLAAKHTPDLWTSRQQAVIRKLAPEIQNIRAAWRWAAERGQIEAVSQTIEFVYRFHRMRGYFQEGERLFRFVREALETATADCSTAELRGTLARLQEGAAMFAFHLSRLAQARVELEESLAVLEELGLARDQGFVRLALGMIAYQAGRLDEAQALFERSRRIFDQIGEPVGASRAILQLGNLHYAAGQYADALDHYRRSREIHERLGDQLGIADCLYNVGRVENIMAHFSEAKEVLNQSLRIYEALEEKQGIAAVQMELGVISTVKGQFQNAQSHFEQALKLRQELGDPALIAETTMYFIGTYFSLGDFERGKALIQKVLDLRPDYEQQPITLGFSSGLLGFLQFFQGNVEKAVSLLRKALGIMGSAGYERERMHAEGYLIMTLIIIEDLENAERLCQKTLSYIDSTEAYMFHAYRLNGLGMIEIARGANAKSETYFKQALHESLDLGILPATLVALENLANHIIAPQDPETALAWLTLVIHHPASDAFQKQTAQQAIAQLAEQLPIDRVEAARERGRQLTLDEVVADILAERR